MAVLYKGKASCKKCGGAMTKKTGGKLPHENNKRVRPDKVLSSSNALTRTVARGTKKK